MKTPSFGFLINKIPSKR